MSRFLCGFRARLKLDRSNVIRAVFVSLLILIVAVYVALVVTGFHAFGYLIILLVLLSPALSSCSPLNTRKGICRETLRTSFDLLRCGVEKPIYPFTVLFLMCLGVASLLEEFGVLRYGVILSGTVITLRSIVLLAALLISSSIATWYASRTSPCHRRFAKLTSGIATRIMYVLIVTGLGLIYIGLGSTGLGGTASTRDRPLPPPDTEDYLRFLGVLGLMMLMLLLYVWAAVVWEKRRRNEVDNTQNTQQTHQTGQTLKTAKHRPNTQAGTTQKRKRGE